MSGLTAMQWPDLSSLPGLETFSSPFLQPEHLVPPGPLVSGRQGSPAVMAPQESAGMRLTAQVVLPL